MSQKTLLALLLAGVLAVVIVAFPGSQLSGSVKWPTDAAVRAVNVFTALLVVAVFQERVLAVVIDLIVPPVLIPISGNKDDIDRALAQSDTDQPRRLRLRLQLGIVLSLLMALAGVRTLISLVDQAPSLPLQLSVFNGLDAFLTAGILVGGSTVIAAIIDFWKARSLLLLRQLRVT